MKKLYWVMVSLVAVAGIGASVYFGLQPKPVGKINYSHFKSPEYFGEALLQRLNHEIKAAQVIFIGVLPEEQFQYEVWSAFLSINQNPETKYDYVVVDKDLLYKRVFTGAQEVDLSEGKDSFVTGLKNILSEGKRVAIVLPTLAVTKQSPTSVTSQIEQDFNYPGFSFTTSKFPRKHEEEKDMPIQCGSDDPVKNTSRLGCFIQKQAKLQYRKKNPEQKIEGMVSQIASKEYLVLIQR